MLSRPAMDYCGAMLGLANTRVKAQNQPLEPC
jgi:hypothetical protein